MEDNICLLPPRQSSRSKTIPSFSQWEKDTYSHCLTKTKCIPSWAFQSMPSAMLCQCQLSNHKRRNKTEKNNLWKTIGSAWVLIYVAKQNPAFFFCPPQALKFRPSRQKALITPIYCTCLTVTLILISEQPANISIPSCYLKELTELKYCQTKLYKCW